MKNVQLRDGAGFARCSLGRHLGHHEQAHSAQDAPAKISASITLLTSATYSSPRACTRVSKAVLRNGLGSPSARVGWAATFRDFWAVTSAGRLMHPFLT